MKKSCALFFVVLLFSISAQARLSCGELDDLSEVLDQLSHELEDVRKIGENGKIDLALGGLTESLNQVARMERDKRLSAWINDLEIAWEDMERDDFEESLDDIIDRLDDLYDRDCDR